MKAVSSWPKAPAPEVAVSSQRWTPKQLASHSGHSYIVSGLAGCTGWGAAERIRHAACLQASEHHLQARPGGAEDHRDPQHSLALRKRYARSNTD